MLVSVRVNLKAYQCLRGCINRSVYVLISKYPDICCRTGRLCIKSIRGRDYNKQEQTSVTETCFF